MNEIAQHLIKTPETYSWRQQMDFLQRYPADLMYRYREGKLERAFDLGSFVWLLRLEAANGGVLVSALNGRPTEAEWREIIVFATEWLDLDRDITPFYQIAADDALLCESAARYRGLQIVGIPRLFEALCWAIIGQQVNISFAYTLKNRLVEEYGSFIIWQGEKYWTFPMAQLIAKLAPSELTKLQLSRGKAEYILIIARAIASGDLTKLELLEMEREAALERLTSYKGVGRWTAEYVMLKSLRRRDIFPGGDAGIKNAVKARLGHTLTPLELQNLAGGWQGWETYATLYLWRTLFAD